MYTPHWYQEEAINAILKWDFRLGHALIVEPTGSGKSVIIACFCERVIKRWPEQKLLILSDNQDILVQDYETIKKQLPNTKIGLYSSGLKSFTIENITVAGIQSVYERPELFMAFNLIAVDEADKVPYKRIGRYHTFFKIVKKPILGLTATPFRMECGLLTSGTTPFFVKIIHETKMDVLLKENKISPISTKEPKQKMDVSGIKKVGGDFSLTDLSLKFDRPAMTDLILDELVWDYPARKKWLVYGIDINHVDHITEGLRKRGISAEALHTGTKKNRDSILRRHKAGEFVALVSVAMLTTGINIPDVDLIALLRPTNSLRLHIQIVGRGTRTAPGKLNCLVRDFAGNFHRLGPINNPIIKDKEAGKRKGDAIMKTCPECFEMVHIAVRICPECKFKFEFQHHLSPFSTTINPLDLEDFHWFTVKEVKYRKQLSKKDKIPMLVAEYYCGLRIFKDYVCLEHTGKARQIAEDWWTKRFIEDWWLPGTVEIASAHCDRLKEPKQILVNTSFKFPQIKEYRF